MNRLQSPLLPSLKALSDDLRLTLLRVMAQHSFAVLELCELLQVRQSSMSFHLKVLAQAGLVCRQREGNSVFYRRATAKSASFMASLWTQLDAEPLPDPLQQALQALDQERLQQAQAFFNKYSHELQQQQALIADYSQYGESALSLLLQQRPTLGSLLELGPGLGEFLLQAAPHCQQLTALDIAPDMLQACRTALRQQGIEADLLQGDMSSLASLGVTYQTVVANMVLHHLPEPSLFFKQVQPVLTADGLLLVTDLCRHDQPWVQDTLGDRWLGFASEELALWAEQAKLGLKQSTFIALRNGFQIQLLLFANSGSLSPS